MPNATLRTWQEEALAHWRAAGHKGIVEIVTGGGKTVFALACIREYQPDTSLIIVPTIALLDQWWEETAAFFDIKLDEVNVITGRGKIKKGTVNLAVLNTAAKIGESGNWGNPHFLVVDECHKAASEKFRASLTGPKTALTGKLRRGG